MMTRTMMMNDEADKVADDDDDKVEDGDKRR
jgi:hypothetical protein